MSKKNSKQKWAFPIGLIVILLAKVLQTTDYNGGGIDVITRIFENGEVKYEAFLFKIF